MRGATIRLVAQVSEAVVHLTRQCPTQAQLEWGRIKLTMDEGVMTWNYTNVYANGQLFATYDAQGLHFDLNDWLGTRRVTTDYAGVPRQRPMNP